MKEKHLLMALVIAGRVYSTNELMKALLMALVVVALLTFLAFILEKVRKR